jgi:GDP/UDP-N,N'-diacetylbacillosamine 2-epimerase (hydrolysing)
VRRILYLTGTRADFGLMRATLAGIQAHPELKLGLLVTGMHLDPRYGDTVREIEASGLPIVARVPVALGDDDGATMARAIGLELLGAVDALASFRPDLLLLLGDRGEMLAGAIAALHLNIPIVHLHGGELSGTVDEPVRHAISKLAHYHFTATEGARERLIRMGEWPEHIHVTGAPGIDGLAASVSRHREELAAWAGFAPDRPIALVVFHPVVQQADEAAAQASLLLDALLAVDGLQALLLLPNADAGGEAIRRVFQRGRERCRTVLHLPRAEFIDWMAAVDVMVGNSSSGIIEAASFGTPVVNVGDRQRGRERGANVRDVPLEHGAIVATLRECLSSGRQPVRNVYGDGHAGARIVELLATLPLDRELLMKCNAY